MIAAVDVHYMEDGSANAGAVVFGDYSDYEAYQTYTCRIPGTEPCVPGQFYKLELSSICFRIVLNCGLQFPLQIIDKISYPAIVFVIFLAIADEAVIFISGDETWHKINYSGI